MQGDRRTWLWKDADRRTRGGFTSSWSVGLHVTASRPSVQAHPWCFSRSNEQMPQSEIWADPVRVLGPHFQKERCFNMSDPFPCWLARRASSQLWTTSRDAVGKQQTRRARPAEPVARQKPSLGGLHHSLRSKFWHYLKAWKWKCLYALWLLMKLARLSILLQTWSSSQFCPRG